jgi:hypothetical protein
MFANGTTRPCSQVVNAATFAPKMMFINSLFYKLLKENYLIKLKVTKSK